MKQAFAQTHGLALEPLPPGTLSPPIAPSIQDITVTNIAMDDALNAIDAAICNRNPMKIAFVNADCINIAAHNAKYRAALQNMDWVFPDGIGLRLAGKILAQPIRDNVNGTDLFPLLCAELAAAGRSLYLLGAKPGVAEAVANWATNTHLGLHIAGTRDGYFKESERDAVCTEIRAAAPDVLLVALGAPRQELWIEQNAQACGANVILGVGGLFDFYSGNIPRAPLWMRRLSLEWVYRLYQEPGRMWKRYLIGNWTFMLRIYRERKVRLQERP